jgi:hypothetical protein
MDEKKSSEEEEEEIEVKQKVIPTDCDFKVKKLENMEEKLYKGMIIIIIKY